MHFLLHRRLVLFGISVKFPTQQLIMCVVMSRSHVTKYAPQEEKSVTIRSSQISLMTNRNSHPQVKKQVEENKVDDIKLSLLVEFFWIS